MSKMRTAKSLKKPPPLVAPIRDAESDVQFELELCWCVQQLETSLNTGKLSQKVADDTAKSIKTLKSGTAPLIKKRQVMKSTFGDYRAKMKDEEKKMALASKQIKFMAAADANKKSSFVKKSAILSSDKNFRFNFNPPVAAEENEHKSSALISKDLDLNASRGGGFKFNFAVEETNEILNLDGLSIKH